MNASNAPVVRPWVRDATHLIAQSQFVFVLVVTVCLQGHSAWVVFPSASLASISLIGVSRRVGQSGRFYVATDVPRGRVILNEQPTNSAPARLPRRVHDAA